MSNQQFKDLNFDDIKTSLKSYLSGKAEYSDYNFEGSTWNLLLDVMAWTTHYIGVHSNLALSETFLDSAEIRSSIVSRAKELGYFPKQNTSAESAVKISTNVEQTHNLVLNAEAGTKFSANLDGESFIFQLKDKTRLYELDGAGDIPVDGSGIPTGVTTNTGNYESFDSLILQQGFANTKTWTVSDPAIDTFIISDNFIDVDTLTITINGTDWLWSQDIVVADGESEIFYLQEDDAGVIQVYFGDGILGKALVGSDVIVANWLSTKADRANDIGVFELTDAIAAIPATQFDTTTITRSSGGTPPESDESVKLLAPKVYATQNRLVTSEDYEALVLARFSYIDAISVWGGEEASPPQFGKVFVSVSKKGVSNSLLNITERTEILAYLDTYKVITQRPEVLDPEYLNINMAVTVTYNQYQTSKSDDQLITLTQDAIGSYYTTNLVNFNSALRMSRLLAAIDDAENAFVDSNVVLTIYKNFQQSINLFQDYQTVILNYGGNTIEPGTFITSTYDNDKYLKDDGIGNIQYYVNNVLSNATIGSINYDAGSILINSVVFPDAAAEAAVADVNNITDQERLDHFEVIQFKMQPSTYNVSTKENNLIARGTESVTLKLLNRDD